LTKYVKTLHISPRQDEPLGGVPYLFISRKTIALHTKIIMLWVTPHKQRNLVLHKGKNNCRTRKLTRKLEFDETCVFLQEFGKGLRNY